MNRNITDEIKEISSILATENKTDMINDFIIEILTKSEVETISKRWQILNLLSKGKTQREIAQNLKVSLCKVTRGSQILKKKNSIIAKYLKKEKNNDYK